MRSPTKFEQQYFRMTKTLLDASLTYHEGRRNNLLYGPDLAANRETWRAVMHHLDMSARWARLAGLRSIAKAINDLAFTVWLFDGMQESEWLDCVIRIWDLIEEVEV